MSFRYVVQEGDTWHRIARIHAVNLSSLTSMNPGIKETEYLVPGEVIQIARQTNREYVVQPKETPLVIARRFGIPLEKLIEVNDGIDMKQLRPGSKIDLPAGIQNRIVRMDLEYGYKELLEDLDQFKQRYSFVEETCIGRSVMGKKIPAIRLGSGPRNLHINASFHANEWITSLVLMAFMEDCCEAHRRQEKLYGKDITSLFHGVTLFVVPMVNPDGVQLVQEGITASHPFYEEILRINQGSFYFRRWKANIRGVDLNDQFPAHWEEEKKRRGAESPSMRDYPGENPLTEPEAIAIAEYTEKNCFDAVVALHTQGQEIYWNYRDYEPKESEKWAERLSSVSGYRSVRLSGSDAGYKDWFIQTFRKPGFTVEAGLGINPLPLWQTHQIKDEIAAILLELMSG